MSEMPSKIKIGPFVYTLEEDKGPLIVDGRTCSGMIDYEDLDIKILPDRALNNRQQTVLHEVFHGIHSYRCFDPAKCEKEVIVDEFAHGMLMVIKQNPDLIKWLMRDE